MIATLAGVVVAGIRAEPAFAQPPAVNHVVAVARPPRYQSPCPARFEFIGTIFVTRARVRRLAGAPRVVPVDMLSNVANINLNCQ
jgi:hypothetical protein